MSEKAAGVDWMGVESVGRGTPGSCWLSFVGGWDGERMILTQDVGADAETFTRMVWSDISPDSMTWTYERTQDAGESWTRILHTAYTRRR